MFRCPGSPGFHLEFLPACIFFAYRWLPRTMWMCVFRAAAVRVFHPLPLHHQHAAPARFPSSKASAPRRPTLLGFGMSVTATSADDELTTITQEVDDGVIAVDDHGPDPVPGNRSARTF